MDRPLRVLTWNLERCPPRRRGAVERHLASVDYDIAVLTEARLGFLHDEGVLSPAGPPPGRFAEDERKVLIWSRWGWEEPEAIPAGVRASRWVAATTVTPSGPLRVVGVCIPYRFAWVHHRPTGEPKRRVWEEHLRFLGAMEGYARRPRIATVIGGDFNQRVPPDNRYDPPHVVEARRRALDGLEVVTAGLRGSDGKPLLCHLATSADLAGPPSVVDRVDGDGVTLSDHHGAVAPFTLVGS